MDPNVDDGEAVIIGTVRAVRRLSDASWPSCRNPTVHIQSAIEQAEADQVCMARDVAIMFDELKALTDRHADLHSDRARLQADVDRLTADLEQARRPWWRRLVGR
jgi:multidrug resistance efflux pump